MSMDALFMRETYLYYTGAPFSALIVTAIVIILNHSISYHSKSHCKRSSTASLISSRSAHSAECLLRSYHITPSKDRRKTQSISLVNVSRGVTLTLKLTWLVWKISLTLYKIGESSEIFGLKNRHWDELWVLISFILVFLVWDTCF